MALWSRTGNVNVTLNNATVNGGSSSPMFITNGVKPGYIFQGPDGREYEILTVPSETQITLASNYLGTTASNQAYAIIPLSAAAYSQVLAQLLTLINTLSTAIVATTLKVGSPTETAAVAAFLGTIVSMESAGNLRVYASKSAVGGNVWYEWAVAKSGRGRIGMIANNNIAIDYSADGSVWTNAFLIDITSNPARITISLPFVPWARTLAQLLAGTSVAGALYYITDLGGGAGYVMGDGTGYKRLQPGYQTINTDASATHTELVEAGAIRHTGTLTANRTITLSNTNARAGAERVYTRTGAGAFNLSIGGLKNLIQNTWCRVKFDGSSWYLAEYGTL